MSLPILIDTQVLVWLFEDRSKIGPQALAGLTSADQSVVVASVSLMEMVMKSATGKLHYDDTIFADLEGVGIEIVAPERIDFASYRIFSEANKDPFDNMLIATALARNYSFMTSDHKILDLKTPSLHLIDARN